MASLTFLYFKILFSGISSFVLSAVLVSLLFTPIVHMVLCNATSWRCYVNDLDLLLIVEPLWVFRWVFSLLMLYALSLFIAIPTYSYKQCLAYVDNMYTNWQSSVVMLSIMYNLLSTVTSIVSFATLDALPWKETVQRCLMFVQRPLLMMRRKEKSTTWGLIMCCTN